MARSIDAAVPDPARALLAAIVASSDDAIVSKTLEGIVTSWNAGAERLFGYTAEEAVGRSITLIIPQDRLHEEVEILSRVRAGLRVEHFETVRRRKDGSAIDISVTVSPVRDESGTIIGASKVARDISERRRHRQELEETLARRTAELEESHRKLRVAERFAALGTLAAGMGHDMGNLILPIFARLDAIERGPLAEESREDVAAVRAAARYLQRVASGLRMMAMDPAENGGCGPTELGSWWEDARSVMRSVLPKSVELDDSITPGLAVRMARHRLTQVIFNLVQNAGEAIAGSGGRGGVRVSAAAGEGGTGEEGVVVSVADDGPGMTDEVRRRCFDPYFSTKARVISTGMGLSLVRSLVEQAGGEITLETAPGRGAAFSLWLPAPHRPDPRPLTRATATVSIAAHGRAAYAAAVLAAQNVVARRGSAPAPGDAYWIAERPDPATLREFLSSPGRRAVVVDSDEARDGPPRLDGAVRVPPTDDAAQLRRAILTIVDPAEAAGVPSD